MAQTLQPLITTLCALLGFTVVLYGLHPNDMMYTANTAHHDFKHADESSKLVSDVHHHIDKQSIKTLQKYTNDSGMQVDARSLRMLKQELFKPRQLFTAKAKTWLAYVQAKLTRLSFLV